MTIVWTVLGLWGYAYIGYPAILLLLALKRGSVGPPPLKAPGPMISVVIPAYNEEGAIAATLEAVLASDYPADRRQIVVVSDASTDATDEIVAGFAPRGVELLRLPQRGGKTAAENAARAVLRGDIVVNTDASVRVAPAAIRRLIAGFGDSRVGVASSTDVSVSWQDNSVNPGEGAYTGYEMWVRALETRVWGIIGASGSLYAIRAQLHQRPLPDALSRDFASALVARESGYRAVSVPSAICYVPRGVSFRKEYSRKVRTMTRGLGTLLYMRKLLNPFRYGTFAWMLASHKLVRWLLPWASTVMLIALAQAWTRSQAARLALALTVATALIAAVGWTWPEGRPMPRLIALPAFAVAGMLASMHAWVRVLTGARAPIWEPTRRGQAVSQ